MFRIIVYSRCDPILLCIYKSYLIHCQMNKNISLPFVAFIHYAFCVFYLKIGDSLYKLQHYIFFLKLLIMPNWETVIQHEKYVKFNGIFYCNLTAKCMNQLFLSFMFVCFTISLCLCIFIYFNFW